MLELNFPGFDHAIRLAYSLVMHEGVEIYRIKRA